MRLSVAIGFYRLSAGSYQFKSRGAGHPACRVAIRGDVSRNGRLDNPISFPETGMVGGVALSRPPPGLCPAPRANRSARAAWAKFTNPAIFGLARNAGPSPGDSLERLPQPA